jgi:hypothetical protein
MCNDGVASMADFPYDPHDSTSLPSEQDFRQAMYFRACSTYRMSLGDTAGINRVRQHLANGYTCAFGLYAYYNFLAVREFGNVYCLSQIEGENLGGHFVTIVGYDDTMATADGPGAFRLVNQWGTYWGDSGYCWISYVAATSCTTSSGIAWFLSDRVEYQPSLIGRVRVRHPYRRSVRFTMGVGPVAQPRWSRSLPRGDGWLVDSFPAEYIVGDLSDAESLLLHGPPESVFVACWDEVKDSLTGTLASFAVEHAGSGRVFESTDPPVAMADSGERAYARVCVALAGVEEKTGYGRLTRADRPSATIVRGVLFLPSSPLSTPHSLLSIDGRKVLDLKPGANDVSRLAPGIYFVRDESRELSAVSCRKVVIAR